MKSINNKQKKKQFKQCQKALISIVTSFAAVMILIFIIALFVSYRNIHNPTNDSSDSEEITTYIYEQALEIESGADDAVSTDITPISINMSDSSRQEFEDYISSIDTKYDFEDAYKIDEALAEYNNGTVNKVTKHSHDIRLNGKFDADHFYDIVKANNKKFFEDEENSTISGFYKEYSNKQLKKICRQMMEALPAIAKKDPTVDLDTVCCYLYNLKIITKLGALDFGGFDMENRFYLNYDWMESAGFAMDTDDIEQTTFYHEMMHAFQFACEDIKKTNENRMGITHTYDELDINPLSWYWLLEGSAEMNLSQYLGVRYSTYKNMITYIDSLNFVSNVGASGGLVKTEKLCFQWDLDKFFKQIDAVSNEEKREIVKMMFSIEIIQHGDDDFYDWYEETFNVDLSSSSNGEETFLRLTVKEDAMMTLAKIFYRSLARQISSGKATLQDAFYLIRLMEADIDRHFSNNTVGYMLFFHNFYDEYVVLQDKFFEILAKDNDFTVDDLINGLENYSMNAVGKSPNCDLKFLNGDSKDYIATTFVNSFYQKGYPSMRSCQQQTIELNEKYPIEDMIVNKVCVW